MMDNMSELIAVPHGRKLWSIDKVRYSYKTAYQRAREQQLPVRRLSGVSWKVPSHTKPGVDHQVVAVGSRWFELDCTCEAAEYGQPSCTHRALAHVARRMGASVTEASYQEYKRRLQEAILEHLLEAQ